MLLRWMGRFSYEHGDRGSGVSEGSCYGSGTLLWLSERPMTKNRSPTRNVCSRAAIILLEQSNILLEKLTWLRRVRWRNACFPPCSAQPPLLPWYVYSSLAVGWTTLPAPLTAPVIIRPTADGRIDGTETRREPNNFSNATSIYSNYVMEC